MRTESDSDKYWICTKIISEYAVEFYNAYVLSLSTHNYLILIGVIVELSLNNIVWIFCGWFDLSSTLGCGELMNFYHGVIKFCNISQPMASNHGALAQLKPSPNVLSGATMYQWQLASGTSTAHLDQSSFHCGTCTHITAAKKMAMIDFMMIGSGRQL